MKEERIFELADLHFGRGKYNKGRVIGFAESCEREGIQVASKLAHSLYGKKIDPKTVSDQEKK